MGASTKASVATQERTCSLEIFKSAGRADGAVVAMEVAAEIEQIPRYVVCF
jgi:hypothetical protein